jgi:hypothetical protein
MQSVNSQLALLSGNPPTLTEFNLERDTRPKRNYFRLLGEALQGNTHVSSLQLNIGTEWMMDLDISSIRASPVVSFLRSSASLRKVVLDNGDTSLDVDEEVIRCFFESIVENPSIEDLSVNEDFSISAAVVRILESTITCSFRSLTLPVWDADQSNAVAAVLRAHQTLERIRLVFMQEVDFDGELSVIVKSLFHHGSLRDLEIEVYLAIEDHTRFVNATSMALLEATTKLDSLTVNFTFSESGAQRFAKALMQHESLTRLTLVDASFDNDKAMSAFVAIMKARSAMKGFSELSFKIDDDLFFETSGRFPGSYIANLLCGPCGSFVKVLRVDTFAALKGLWSGMEARKGYQSRVLYCIKMPTVIHEPDNNELPDVALRKSNRAMVRLIPDLLYLRELWLGQVPHDVDVFVCAIQKNSSLYGVWFNPDVGFGELEYVKYFLRVFGERNAKLPTLLVGHQQLQPENNVHSLEHSTIRLLPELLSAAQQMPRVALGYMLTGLLASIGNVGPSEHSFKRRREEPQD